MQVWFGSRIFYIYLEPLMWSHDMIDQYKSFIISTAHMTSLIIYVNLVDSLIILTDLD